MARFHSENGHVGQLGDIYGMGDTGDMGDTDNMGSIGEVGNKSATTSFAGKLNINSAGQDYMPWNLHAHFDKHSFART
eukprot:1368995-Amorphochlora_amoeboformis.AAC.2